eukprot:snap_masked-scaffold1890_size25423-processed-gene-0.3 protein:Tk04605 transcript:snap_masked-scaffold1890_size25423-processed-gene-0.3-mRNA-1 annotation:"iditol 2-dehydrogenase"
MAQIPERMTAVVIRGKEDYRLETVAVPKPGPKEVLVKVLAVGICAGDAKTYDGATRFWGDGKDIPSYVEPPVIPGHEFSGVVVALGDGALEHHGVDIGDLTVSEQIVPCQTCRYCERGQYQMCIPHDVYGFHQVTPGAMAQYLIYPAKAIVHKVPKSVDPFHACFVEPLACSLHAVELGNIQFNDVVVVSGCGPLGLGMVAGAKLKSPKCLIALDMVDWKVNLDPPQNGHYPKAVLHFLKIYYIQRCLPTPASTVNAAKSLDQRADKADLLVEANGAGGHVTAVSATTEVEDFDDEELCDDYRTGNQGGGGGRNQQQQRGQGGQRLDAPQSSSDPSLFLPSFPNNIAIKVKSERSKTKKAMAKSSIVLEPDAPFLDLFGTPEANVEEEEEVPVERGATPRPPVLTSPLSTIATVGKSTMTVTCALSGWLIAART